MNRETSKKDTPQRGGARPGAGRKKKPPGEKSYGRMITMPPKSWEALDEICKRQKMTISSFVRLKVEAEGMRRVNQE